MRQAYVSMRQAYVSTRQKVPKKHHLSTVPTLGRSNLPRHGAVHVLGLVCHRLQRQYLYVCSSQVSKVASTSQVITYVAFSGSAFSVSICTFVLVLEALSY
jgi:hypothetical protein